MAHNFSVDDVFEMAEMMERNGADFYRDAAGKTDDPELKGFLMEMATMEVKHAAMFRKWRDELSNVDPLKKLFEEDNEGAEYLKTIVDGRVSFEHDEHGADSIEEILKGAIASEKETVIFYLQIQESIPEYLGKDKISRLISEELEHVRSLTQKMRQLALKNAQKSLA